ncbi:MAG: DUF2911 domain-containing protein [Cytophagales bacterium]|nr:DUF2911 domain-containing protein [Cytophagales bacterium]
MLRKILIGFGVVILAFGIYVVYLSLTTKSHSPAEQAIFKSEALDLTVRYCRPYMKDRKVFGTSSEDVIVPYGEKWRAGANEATEIKLNKDLIVGDQLLPSGTYSVYCIPEKEFWTVVFNSRTNYWGASFLGDPFKEEYDVLRARAEVSDLSADVEQFGIALQQSGERTVDMTFAWEKTQASLTFTY